jgi:release factor glutamine methyltransferase
MSEGPGTGVRKTGSPASHATSSARGQPTSVGSLVAALSGRLGQARVDDPEREARDIVAALLEVPRFWASVHAQDAVPEGLTERAWRAVSRRARGAPFAYAVGCAAFRTITLEVDERVLIPRPETELLVEIALEETRSGGVVIDVGTGSGAVALALAAEGLFDRVVATDVSTDALEVARANAARLAPVLRCPVEFRAGTDLEPASDVSAAAIVSNPPYIAFDEAVSLPGSVRDWEPAVALFAAHDGMAVIRRIVRSAADVLEPAGLLALEVDARRASLAVEAMAADGRYRDISVRLDLAGRERFVVAHRMETV